MEALGHLTARKPHRVERKSVFCNIAPVGAAGGASPELGATAHHTPLVFTVGNWQLAVHSALAQLLAGPALGPGTLSDTWAADDQGRSGEVGYYAIRISAGCPGGGMTERRASPLRGEVRTGRADPQVVAQLLTISV